MKKQLLLFVMMLLSIIANASVEINGIYYDLIRKSKTAEVAPNPNYYQGNIIIPETVTYNDVTYTVTTIGNRAFQYCSGLSSITIPNSIETVCLEAFSGCYGLQSVHIYDLEKWCKIAFEGNLENPLFWAHHLYLNGVEITDLVIPDNVTSIGSYIFIGCSGLSSVTFHNNVTSIGEYAFQECTSLRSVNIPNSVTSIGTSAFMDCSGLLTVTLPNGLTKIEPGVFWNCTSLTSINIPNSVTEIWHEAFSGCTSLETVDIGTGVKYINGEAFENCKNLTDVYCRVEEVPRAEEGIFLDSHVEYSTLYVPYGTKKYYEVASEWKDFGKIIEMPKSEFDFIYTDEGLVVKNCEESSESVVIPATIDVDDQTYQIIAVGEGAFMGKTNIVNVSIENGIKQIGASAFEGCNNLAEIILGSDITNIGEKAFANIVSQPSTARRSDKAGFTVYCSSKSVPKVASNAFENTPIDKALLVVNDDLLNEYCTTEPWSMFGTIKGFSEETGINAILTGEGNNAVIYTLEGKLLDKLQKGLNIIRMSNGSVRKIVFK